MNSTDELLLHADWILGELLCFLEANFVSTLRENCPLRATVVESPAAPLHVFVRQPLTAVIPANPCWKAMSVIPHGDVAQCQGRTGWPFLLFDWEQARVDPPLLPDWVPSQFSDEQCRSNPSWLTLMNVFVFNGRRQNVKIHLQSYPCLHLGLFMIWLFCSQTIAAVFKYSLSHFVTYNSQDIL